MTNTAYLRGSVVEAALEDMRAEDGSLKDWVAFLDEIGAEWEQPSESEPHQIAIHGPKAEQTACWLKLKYAGLATYSVKSDPDFIAFRQRSDERWRKQIQRLMNGWVEAQERRSAAAGLI